jgi:hypothetical protein
MSGCVLLVGFDADQSRVLSSRLNRSTIAFEMLPRLLLKNGVLTVQSPETGDYLAIDRVVFHGIFEEDIEFLSAIALWNGPCFPNPLAMIRCRLRLPCLVEALRHTRFGGTRGFASKHATYRATTTSVAKWGNWHCGDNKAQFHGDYLAKEPTLIEPFIEGEAVRIIVVKEPRQIRMAGKNWLKSVHGSGAEFTAADPELVADTLAIQKGMGLDILANDYMIGKEGPYLLEVNHIPSVDCLPGLWDEYVERIVEWSR